MLSSISTIERLFGVNNEVLGLPRYEDDDYRRISNGITGNYWFITSFWLAQYYIGIGKTDKSMVILDWAKSNAMTTGVMSEQIDPVTYEIVSPAPLTWTHAEYISTLLDTIPEARK
jgi:GH15 family glucan-1,4-alpha-glucosidase